MPQIDLTFFTVGMKGQIYWRGLSGGDNKEGLRPNSRRPAQARVLNERTGLLEGFIRSP
jgi:hypothetical protein